VLSLLPVESMSGDLGRGSSSDDRPPAGLSPEGDAHGLATTRTVAMLSGLSHGSA